MSSGDCWPKRFGVAEDGVVIQGNQGFLDIIARFDHFTQMRCGDAVDPGVGKELIRFMAGLQKILVGQRDNFLFVEIAGSDFELYVDGVGVADGDRVLRPAELNLPGSAERIGPGFKRAIVIDHASAIVAAISPVVQGGEGRKAARTRLCVRGRAKFSLHPGTKRYQTVSVRREE